MPLVQDVLIASPDAESMVVPPRAMLITTEPVRPFRSMLPLYKPTPLLGAKVQIAGEATPPIITVIVA